MVGVTARLLTRGLAWKLAAGVVAALLCLLFFLALLAASVPSPANGAAGECAVTARPRSDIPSNYVPWLQRAAVRYRLGSHGFSIVAAIHRVESDFGRSNEPGVHSGTNSAGAAGPGQFLAKTWAAYGVDADGDGRKNVYGVPDSVFATANYLHASGAPRDWRAAIFAYNHAEWYVQRVLATASDYSAEPSCADSASAQLGSLPAARLARVEYVARWIEARRIHYCWGGGHAAKPGPSTGAYCWSADGHQILGAAEKGLDCSGAVRWLLVLSGYPDPGALRSDHLGAAFPPGPGQHVTIWSNVDHVFVEINDRDWGTSSSHFAHGPGFGPQSTAGFAPSHPPGL